MYEKIETQTEQKVDQTPTQKADNAFTPPRSRPTPEWVKEMAAKKMNAPNHVKVVQQALDLISYNDGIFWCEGAEGMGIIDSYESGEIDLDDDHSSVDPAKNPFGRGWLLDFMPDGRFQAVTEKVCAIGSIMCIMGARNGDPDYETVINNLNVIANEKYGNGIVQVNDGMGRQFVQECFKEYVNRYDR